MINNYFINKTHAKYVLHIPDKNIKANSRHILKLIKYKICFIFLSYVKQISH